MHGYIPDWFMTALTVVGWAIDHQGLLLAAIVLTVAIALAFAYRRCAHRFEFAYNLYGDQINDWGGKRSVWKCAHCGKLQARDTLHQVRQESQ